MDNRQIFSTSSPQRWQRIKWATRVVVVALMVPIAMVIISIKEPNKPALPALFNQFKDYKTAIERDTTVNNKEHSALSCSPKMVKSNHLYPLSKRTPLPMAQRMRAAFYVNWDLQSFYALRDNVGSLNMVLPEWLHVTDADTVVADIDARALDFLSQHPTVQVVPMITNYWQEKWQGQNVINLTRTPEKRKKFIDSVLRLLKKYHFQGVNVDFESLDTETDNRFLTQFQTELYAALHTEGYLVSQDVNPLSEDYDLNALATVNDNLFIMAYDLHNDQSDAGEIAPQKWVEDIIERTSRTVDPQKLVLCLAGYGYDWPEGAQKAEDITFQEALAIAQESEAAIHFDNNSYNLHFNYTDDKGTKHTVYFTDAASNFNAIRAADDAGWRGVALWRLGSEDPRLWRFYNKNISNPAPNEEQFDVTSVKSALIADNVDYIGEGEILDVLSEPKDGKVRLEFDPAERLITEEYYDELPTSYVVQKFGKADSKKLVLTFDDGPDPEWTRQILDILKKENVPATFFVVGKNAEENLPLLKRLYTEGYEIGNHSFSHPNMADVPEWRSNLELNATRRLIESITGRSTLMFRAPYLADAEPETREELLPVVIAKRQNYLTIGESIDPLDWQPGVSADTIVARCIREQSYGSMILLHDAGGNRAATVEALPKLIRYFKENGYTFTTVADLMHKTRDDLMPPIPPRQAMLDRFDAATATTIYWIQRGLGALFFTAIGLSIVRILTILTLAILQKRKEKNAPIAPKTDWPPVSIIVPAYNEAVTAVGSVKSLLQQRYPHFEIIFVDDGSTDATYAIVKNAFAQNPAVKVLTKTNGGKASALNTGIAHATSDYVVCIDADTQLAPDALEKLMRRFDTPSVAAVAGNVRVGNPKNWLTRWQAIEYTTAQNFDRLAFAYLNAITVVPGAIGAFRKAAIESVGGFTTDTLAEDCDLTMRLLRGGHTVGIANDAVAITEAPETLRQFLKQRFRWSFGVMQAFWKNRDTLLNPAYKGLGMAAMPNILIFQLVLPIFAPIADLILLFGLFTGGAAKLLIFYVLMLSIDVVCSVVAFRFEGASLRSLWLMLPQRLVYRPLMYAVLFKSYRRALKGELQSWGVLKRTGNVVVRE